MVLIFGLSYHNFSQSIYFVPFLFPIGVGTALFINYYLIPSYLFTRKDKKFFLFLLYTLVISIYLELLVLTLSLILLANYRYENLNPRVTDVLQVSFIRIFSSWCIP